MADLFRRAGFRLGLLSSLFFRRVGRKFLYKEANGDPEEAHRLALGYLNKYCDIARASSPLFSFPSLEIDFAGRKVMPFATAAGLDKNADALEPLSYLFGIHTIGTIVLPEREGNPRPRVYADEKTGIIYNAQGFPSKGLNYAKGKLEEYRGNGGNGVVVASICGLPQNERNLNSAFEELETIATELNPFVDGFEWNPFSPNTKALQALRKPTFFKDSGKILDGIAPSKVKLVKMGPYEKDAENDWLDLAAGFLEGGGDGLVAVNTYKLLREDIPVKHWGFESAGASGNFLREYRARAIRAARKRFPEAIIGAVGGIEDTEGAFSSLMYADFLQGYTPYTFQGFGLMRKMAQGLDRIVRESDYNSWEEFKQVWRRNNGH